MATRVIAWIEDSWLAHKFLELAKVMELAVEIPRRASITCGRNIVVVTDNPQIASRLQEECMVLVIRKDNILDSMINIVSFFRPLSAEVVVGVDLGMDKLAYVVISSGLIIDYGICVNCVEEFVERICGIRSRRVFVGIGYASSVSSKALELYNRLRACGVEASVVDEMESNKSVLMGLRGSELLRKVDLKAAAIVALRARTRGGSKAWNKLATNNRLIEGWKS